MKTTVGSKIRQLRELREVSQMGLEVKINAAWGSISKIETGKTNPTKETLFKIGEALELDQEELSMLFDLREEEANVNDLFKISGNFNIEINSERLRESLIMEVLSHIDSKYGSISTSYSEVNLKAETIQLKYISENSITKYIGSKLFKESGFRILPLNQNPTLTKQSALTGKIISDNKLHRFISPPLNPNLAHLIQRFYRVGSMTAIPIFSDTTVVAVINLSLKREVSRLTDKDHNNFKDIQAGVIKVLKWLESF